MSRILVAHATRAGSTIEIAHAIAEVLRETGATVELYPIKRIESPAAYDACVIGSAIRMGAWLPEAVKFVEHNQDALKQMPTAFFVVSGFLKNNTPEMRQTVLGYLEPVRKIVEPNLIGLFAGKMDYSHLSWLDRTIAKGVGQTQGDWRDWDAVRQWAKEAEPVLMPEPAKGETT